MRNSQWTSVLTEMRIAVVLRVLLWRLLVRNSTGQGYSERYFSRLLSVSLENIKKGSLIPAVMIRNAQAHKD